MESHLDQLLQPLDSLINFGQLPLLFLHLNCLLDLNYKPLIPYTELFQLLHQACFANPLLAFLVRFLQLLSLSVFDQ